MSDPAGTSTFQAWWRLLRGGNALLAGGAAGVGAWLIEPGGDWRQLLLIAAAPALITAAGNIQNDLCDLAADRLNQPSRPLAANRIKPRIAAVVTWVLFASGVAVALILSLPALAIALGVVLGLSLYNHHLSRTPLWGNMLVAFMGGLPVVYGAVAAGMTLDTRGLIVLCFAVIAFWLHLARELLKDVLDIEGDRLAGRATIPILHSPALAMRLAAGAMLCGAAATLWPAIAGWFSPLYLFGVLLTIIPALVLGAAQCWWRNESPIAAQWSAGLKLCMLAGLLWIVLGSTRM